ncbi:uncharacterized protein ppp1r3aa [Denticeps clupeoides]|uniref:uncharacterized protein ppp1r3aa n=1 Tax=Denticeps clupeoides TaxID=299321 RepID=UPI0010A4C855|nr:uncharacterized protein LOC114765012 [Denticeps clupeoides]
MSAEEMPLTGVSSNTQPPGTSCCVKYVTKDDEEEREEDQEIFKWVDGSNKQGFVSSLICYSNDSDDSGPETPTPIVRRKVSFADAFGLNLVSVVEFDSLDKRAQVEDLLFCPEGKRSEEYYISALFTTPLNPEDILSKVAEQKLELEAIEILPGTSTLRGIVQVANICFQKAVYVRTTLDGWKSHFDLLADYMPGSSDGTTDRFVFRLTLVPPFEPDGTRVEFCLRYETANGTFWANNNNMNYVLFCRQRVGRDAKEKDWEENNHRGKRSCLKTVSKKICTESNPLEATMELPDLADLRTRRSDRKAGDNAEAQAGDPQGDQRESDLPDKRRSRRRTKMALLEDYFAQRGTESQIRPSQGSENANEVSPESQATPEDSVPAMNTCSTYGLLEAHGLEPDKDNLQIEAKNQPKNCGKSMNLYVEPPEDKSSNIIAPFVISAHMEEFSAEDTSGTAKPLESTQLPELNCPSGNVAHVCAEVQRGTGETQSSQEVEGKPGQVTEGPYSDTCYQTGHKMSRSTPKLRELTERTTATTEPTFMVISQNVLADDGMSHAQKRQHLFDSVAQVIGGEHEVKLHRTNGDSMMSLTDTRGQEKEKTEKERQVKGNKSEEEDGLPQGKWRLETEEQEVLNKESKREDKGRVSPERKHCAVEERESSIGTLDRDSELSDPCEETRGLLKDETKTARETQKGVLQTDKEGCLVDINDWFSEKDKKTQTPANSIEIGYRKDISVTHDSQVSEKWSDNKIDNVTLGFGHSTTQKGAGDKDATLTHQATLPSTCESGTPTCARPSVCPLTDDMVLNEVSLKMQQPPQEAEEAKNDAKLPRVLAEGPGRSLISESQLPDWEKELCQLSLMPRALMYSILFAIFFATAYVCDIPACIPMYLLSLCCWYCQEEKQHLPESEPVD